MALGLVVLSLAHAGVILTLPSTTQHIEINVGAESEIEGAVADFEAGRFAEAARRFEALGDAGGAADAYYLAAVALTEHAKRSPAPTSHARGGLPTRPRICFEKRKARLGKGGSCGSRHTRS